MTEDEDHDGEVCDPEEEAAWLERWAPRILALLAQAPKGSERTARAVRAALARIIAGESAKEKVNE